MDVDLPEKKASVEVPGVKVVIDENDSWETIGMVLVLVLGLYAGIKLIDRLLNNKKK